MPASSTKSTSHSTISSAEAIKLSSRVKPFLVGLGIVLVFIVAFLVSINLGNSKEEPMLPPLLSDTKPPDSEKAWQYAYADMHQASSENEDIITNETEEDADIETFEASNSILEDALLSDSKTKSPMLKEGYEGPEVLTSPSHRGDDAFIKREAFLNAQNQLAPTISKPILADQQDEVQEPEAPKPLEVRTIIQQPRRQPPQPPIRNQQPTRERPPQPAPIPTPTHTSTPKPSQESLNQETPTPTESAEENPSNKEFTPTTIQQTNAPRIEVDVKTDVEADVEADESINTRDKEEQEESSPETAVFEDNENTWTAFYTASYLGTIKIISSGSTIQLINLRSGVHASGRWVSRNQFAFRCNQHFSRVFSDRTEPCSGFKYSNGQIRIYTSKGNEYWQRTH